MSAGRTHRLVAEPRTGDGSWKRRRRDVPNAHAWMVGVAVVTGSSGLLRSETVAFLAARAWRVHGIDNNLRPDSFGEPGDTRWNLARLRQKPRRSVVHQVAR